MSIKIQKLALQNVRQAVQMHDAMHKKAGEMIELMRIVRSDALKRKRQYAQIEKALKVGFIGEAKRLFAEMQTWRKYKINL